MIKRMTVATFILFALLLFMLPRTDDASKKKMASAAMLMCSNGFRQAVMERVGSGQPMELQFDNSCPELIADVLVDESGTITLQGAQHGIRMELSPVSEGGRFRWSCSGEPAEAITKLCKP